MPVYRARWVLPVVAPPLRDGWVQIEAGRIVALGDASARPRHTPLELGARVILPGLINAHTHLELSRLRGLSPPAASLPEWIRSLMALVRERPVDDQGAIREAIAEARAAGTSAIGDITNTLATVDALRESALTAVVFGELLGFAPHDAHERVASAVAAMDRRTGGNVRTAVAAHAPYSVSPHLFREVRDEARRRDDGLCAVHLAESPEEMEFVRTASGSFRSLLEDLGAWDPQWQPPGTTPAEYLDDLGFLTRGLIAVHGTQLTAHDLDLLRRRDVVLVTCPRSNVWTGVGPPPVSAFFRSGVRLGVGTDSLASCPDLNLFTELREIRGLAPDVPAGAILDAATRGGADALRLPDLGRIAVGARADLVAVEIPAAIDDVEEYLVSGVRPEQITWL